MLDRLRIRAIDKFTMLKLSPVERLVYLTICSYANEDELFWRCQTSLAEACGYGRQRTCRAVRKLIDIGALVDTGDRRGIGRQVAVIAVDVEWPERVDRSFERAVAERDTCRPRRQVSSPTTTGGVADDDRWCRPQRQVVSPTTTRNESMNESVNESVNCALSRASENPPPAGRDDVRSDASERPALSLTPPAPPKRAKAAGKPAADRATQCPWRSVEEMRAHDGGKLVEIAMREGMINGTIDFEMRYFLNYCEAKGSTAKRWASKWSTHCQNWVKFGAKQHHARVETAPLRKEEPKAPVTRLVVGEGGKVGLLQEDVWDVLERVLESRSAAVPEIDCSGLSEAARKSVLERCAMRVRKARPGLELDWMPPPPDPAARAAILKRASDQMRAAARARGLADWRARQGAEA